MVTTWRRYNVAQLMYEGLERLQEFCLSANVVLRPFIVYSEKHHELQAKARGWDAVYADNAQLGEKHNVGYRSIRFDFDYFMQLGSDDLLSNAGMAAIIAAMRNGVEFGGFRDLYIVKFSTKQALEIKGFIAPMGAGRFISRRVFKEAGERVEVRFDRDEDEGLRKVYGDTGWMSLTRANAQEREVQSVQHGLWTPEIQCGLDRDSMERIFDVQSECTWIDGAHLVDIKDEQSINAFESFDAVAHEIKAVAFTSLLKSFPELRKL